MEFNIENKRVVITGATSGIGKEVAIKLASLGAHVVLACRDGVRGTHLASDINAGVGAERAAVMTVDTSDPSLRGQASNHPVLRWPKTVVVSDRGKARKIASGGDQEDAPEAPGRPMAWPRRRR